MSIAKDKFYFFKNNLFTSYEVTFPQIYAFEASANEAQKAKQ